MSIRKTQNTALFAATLGVYLGLLLAGSTPYVLAQAATAKQFDLKEETGRSDDLDKKPKGCDLSPDWEKITDYKSKFLWFNDRSIDDYTRVVESILNSYPERVLGVDISWKSEGDFRPSRKVTTSLSYPFGLVDDETSQFLNDEVLYLGNGFPGKAFQLSVLRNSQGTQFRFESQQIPYDAPLVRALYSSALGFVRCSGNPWDKDVVLENTELTVEKNHLVIITRLPRGSLDTLLTSDVK